MKLFGIALLLTALTGCTTVERVPAVDELGRKWLIECDSNNVRGDGTAYVNAECKAVYITPTNTAHPGTGDK